MTRLLPILMWTLFSLNAYADCETTSGPIRKCYDNSSALPVVVFRLFVRQIYYDSLESKDDRFGSYFVEAGLTPNMDADSVLYYFASSYPDIEKEVEQAQKRTLCIDGKPRYSGRENFLVFNQLEEISLSIYEKHRLFARSDLMAPGLFDLDRALDEYPGSFADMFMDHDKASRGSVQRIYEVAEQLCSGPWGLITSSKRSSDSDFPEVESLKSPDPRPKSPE